MEGGSYHTLPNPKATWDLETPGTLRVGGKSEAKNEGINQKSIITLDFLLSHSYRSTYGIQALDKNIRGFPAKEAYEPQTKDLIILALRGFQGKSLLPTKYSRRKPLD